MQLFCAVGVLVATAVAIALRPRDEATAPLDVHGPRQPAADGQDLSPAREATDPIRSPKLGLVQGD